MQDWDGLRYVLAVTREGGLSGAARALGVTHATVSRQVARAEQAAGTPFFTRLATGLVPTEAGAEAAARAARIEAEILALDLALAARDDRATGDLTVTVPPLLMLSGLAEDLTEFRQMFPGISLSVLGGNAPLNLHRREADIAIRVARDPTDSLWGRVIARQRAGWFATPGFLRDHSAAMASGGAVPVVSFTAYSDPLPPSLVQHLPGAEVVVVSDDMVGAAALARAGMGLVRMPWFLGEGDPDLVPVPGVPLIDYMPIWVLTHPDLRRLPRVVEFMRFVAGRFAGRADRYYGPPEVP
ncbi:LysR family transcriptional regulator [Actibacterium sp. XHP0104]|uniref:LysR family transcriptional regulator n=1 Tax=Actibacterium sp. XHP0104 TaxID=2984335 RepID=UPI0021E760E8|nr:LysR family transcriptional regulator [Actibacterium sp. XHP0104]MCV2880827.1 LysR family transcriptional regulator [Actibacterium sp. XHP0104]